MTSILVQMAHEATPYYYPGKGCGKDYDKPHSMINASCRPVGELSLCCAVIEQALQDYFVLVRRGAMRFGKLVGDWEEHTDKQTRKGTKKIDSKCRVGAITRTEAKSLVDFLQHVDRFADAIELKYEWSGLWERIIYLEKTGQYRGAFDL